jgi:hypothetical protein
VESQKSSPLKGVCWNVRSLNNKVEDVIAYLSDNAVTVLFVTETWITDSNNNITAAIKSHGYRLIHKIRKSDKTRGGGVALIYRDNLNLTQVFIKHGETFESVSAKFRDKDGETVCCSCVYRPGVLGELFFSEFDEFLGTIFLKFTRIIICGDLNIHLDSVKSRNCIKFTELLSSYGLQQLVSTPTHKLGHLLDVVITSHKMIDCDSINVHKLDMDAFTSCDHMPVSFVLSNCTTGPNNDKKTICFRNIKHICNEDFRRDLLKELNEMSAGDSFQKAIELYNQKCSRVIDQHAPLLTKQIVDRKNAQWFDGEYKKLRATRRKAQSKWIKTRRPEDRQQFELIRSECTKLALAKKQEFFKTQFQKHSYSSKSLFKFVDTFMDKDTTLTLPPTDSLKDTVDNFNNYFQEKIENIRKKFPEHTTAATPPECTFQGNIMADFTPASIDEIRDILKDADFKSSILDPLPSSLLKENQDIILPLICDLVNASLSSGSIDGAKLAHITPLIKGDGLDNSEYKNYRPISNLTLIGKLIERVVLRRLNAHMDNNNLNVSSQSGYKKCHSTETLLIRVVNDLLIASSESKATIVMLLDLSAAFDTVDHVKLLTILKNELGIIGTAWEWFKSFLTGRCQRVKVDGQASVEIIIKFGVPQGSVLGPVLFNIYIRSLYATAKSLNFAIQGYADDHQVYKSFSCIDQYTTLMSDLPECFRQIQEWMSAHFLQLNAGKTEIIVFGSPTILNELSIQGTFLDADTCVRFSPVVKNLGFRIDSHLNFKQQVACLKSTCFNKLRYIAKMKPFLTTKQMGTLVQAVIVSSLDYCNAMYYGCNRTVLSQLQTIQNRACRVVFGLKKRESVEDRLQSLHWLKVNERIEFKLLLLAYKSIHGLAPIYLSELLYLNGNSGRRRSSLHIPLGNNSCKARAFQLAVPKLWHNLPNDIKECPTLLSFKSNLKTFLFKKSYNIN